MKNNIKNIVAFILLTGLAACGGKTNTETKTTTAKHSVLEVALTPEQVKAIGLQLGTINQRNLKTTLKANGKLTLPAQNMAQVSIAAGGIVRDILVKEGQLVQKGQGLAVIENAEFLQLQQDYLENKAKLGFLTKEYERQKQLQQENINAGKTFQQAEADYLTAQAKDKGMAERLKIFGVDAARLTAQDIKPSFVLVAPITGNIHRIAVYMGKYAEPNKELFDIVDNRDLHIDLTIYEQDIHKVAEGQRLTFSDANDAAHIHTGTIFSVNKAFEDNQQAVIAHAHIDDATETLLPGMFVEARIQVDNYSALTLPEEAIVNNGDEHYIFVEHEPNVYRQIPVRTGAADVGYTEVIPLEEVLPQQKIVVKGAYYLLSELTRGSAEHDH